MPSHLCVGEAIPVYLTGNNMIPLCVCDPDEEQIIKRIGGTPEVRLHLENLGFVVGGTVKIVSSMGGNLIVNVKDSRVAISREMAQKIYV